MKKSNRPKTYNKYWKIYLPSNVFNYLHLKIEQNHPDKAKDYTGIPDWVINNHEKILNKLKPFKYDIDIFYHILYHIIYSKPNGISLYKNNHNMIPLCAKEYLIPMYGGNKYKQHLTWLFQNNLIYSTKYYKEGTCLMYGVNQGKETEKQSKYTNYTYSLQFNNNNKYETITINNDNVKPNLANDTIVIKINKGSFLGKKIDKIETEKRIKFKNQPEHIKILAKHIREIKFNYNEAMLFVNEKFKIEDREKVKAKYNHRIGSILAIKNKSFRINRSSTSKRLYSNLTGMASELRCYIVGAKNMVYLDLKNSQPVIFNILLDRDYIQPQNHTSETLEEIIQYKKETLNGNWYEYLSQKFNKTRDEAKDIWMKIAYSDIGHYIDKKKIFADYFPNLYRIIEGYKVENNSDLPVTLQMLEAEIFIDEICKKIIKEGIIPYTIHDGLIVNKEDQKRTLEVMEEVLEKYLGGVPVISIDNVV